MSELQESNKKPQGELGTQPQGKVTNVDIGNSITLGESKAREELKRGKARYEKGMELYRQGKVSIGKDGYYKVNGFTVDTERVKCECPDYRNRSQACKHYFAACFFQKNRGKVKIEHLNCFEDNKGVNPKPETPSKKSEKNTKPNSIFYDKQRVITRLAVLNTAVEVLKTHGESIQSESLFETARQLEQWALGQVD